MPGVREGAAVHAEAGDAAIDAKQHAALGVKPMQCGPCGPSPGPRPVVAAHERLDANAEVGATAVDVHERADVGVGGANGRMFHPCHPPCPTPGEGQNGGVGVHQQAGVTVDAGEETVAAGERVDVVLKMGEGCRKHPSDPHAPDMKAGRRVDAIEKTLDVLGGRLDRLDATLEGLMERLASGDLSVEQTDELNAKIGRVLDRLDDIAQKIEELQAKLEAVLDQVEAGQP